VQRSGDRAFGSVLEKDVELGFSALGAQISDGIVMTYGAIDSDPTTVRSDTNLMVLKHVNKKKNIRAAARTM
jgi:hypothetical protein